MANISVTYTFTNGATSDATEVNTNFQDIIDGTSDGTKDLSVAALTAAGTLTANGAVNLGNATTDDVTITGRIASDLDPKTASNNTLGDSTQLWLAAYLNTLFLRDTSAAFDVEMECTSSTTATAARKLTIDMVNAARTIKMNRSLDFSNSIVRVHTGNGHGSTNTKIRRYTTAQTNQGGAVTYADSATAGGSFTINNTGLYYMTVVDKYDGGTQSNIGISLNSSQLTTDVESITTNDRLFYTNTVTNVFNGGSMMSYLTATDVVRVHTNGTPNDNTARSLFVIAQVL